MNNLEQRANDAHERHKRILVFKERMVEDSLRLGEALFWFYTDEQWRDLGHNSFPAYIADPEVNIGRAWAYQLIAVHKKYWIEFEPDESLAARLVEAGPDKLVTMKHIVTPENVEEWLDKASALSRSDLRIEAEVKGKGDNGQEKPYDAVNPPNFYIWGILDDALYDLIRKFPVIRPELKIIKDLLRDAKAKLEAENDIQTDR